MTNRGDEPIICAALGEAVNTRKTRIKRNHTLKPLATFEAIAERCGLSPNELAQRLGYERLSVTKAGMVVNKLIIAAELYAELIGKPSKVADSILIVRIPNTEADELAWAITKFGGVVAAKLDPR